MGVNGVCEFPTVPQPTKARQVSTKAQRDIKGGSGQVEVASFLGGRRAPPPRLWVGRSVRTRADTRNARRAAGCCRHGGLDRPTARKRATERDLFAQNVPFRKCRRRCRRPVVHW